MPKLKPLALILLAISLVIAAILAVLFVVPIPRSVRVNQSGATGNITTLRGFVPTPGTCTIVRWDVEGIAGIYFNGEGTVGVGEQPICIYTDSIATIQIAFSDGSKLDYRAPVTILVNTPGVWLAGLFAVAAFIAAGAIQFAPQGASLKALQQALSSITLVGVSLVITLLLLEGAIRLYVGATGTERDKLVYLGSRDEILASNSTTIPLPFINFGGVPGEKGINQYGFRSPDVEHPKPEGVYRILTLGGSTTYGHDVSAGEAYPMQLQNVLREDYGYANVEVVNGGFPAYTTLNSLINFETRGIEQEPDLILIYHAYNDMVRRWQQPSCYAGENPLRGFGGDPGVWQSEINDLNPSALVRFVQISFGLIPDPLSFESRLYPTDLCDSTQTVSDYVERLAANPPTYFVRNLETIIAIAHGNNIDVMLTTQPMNTGMVAEKIAESTTIETWHGMDVGQNEHNDLIRALATEQDVYFYDYVADITYNPDVWQDNIHMNAIGLRERAEHFAEFIDAEDIIPRADSGS